MIPAKSTSDQRTYSSMTTVAARGRGGASPGEARSLRRGAEAVHPVRLEAPPQRRAADPQAPRRFRQLAACVLQGVGDRLAFAFGESEGTGWRKDCCFT